MTLIVGINLIEGPVLISDSRSTNKKTGKYSDTATKIYPLTKDMIVGVVGNPYQAAKIIKELVDLQIKNKSFKIFDYSFIKNCISTIVQDVPLNQNPKCSLIFTSIDHAEKQKVPTDRIKEYFDKYGTQFDDGTEYPATLTFEVIVNKRKGDVIFNFPKSNILTYFSGRHC